MRAGGVGSQETSKMSWFTCSGKAGERFSEIFLSWPGALAVKLNFVNWGFKP